MFSSCLSNWDIFLISIGICSVYLVRRNGSIIHMFYLFLFYLFSINPINVDTKPIDSIQHTRLFRTPQISATIIYFTDTLWPEFTIWQLLAGIFFFQRHHPAMADSRRKMQYTRDSLRPPHSPKHTVDFIARFERSRIERLKTLASIPQNKLS